MEAMDDDILSDTDKINIAIRLLVDFPRPLFTISKAKLWGKVYEQCIKPKDVQGNDYDQAFDFTQDAGYIFAAFWQAYRIDLQKERKRLDWREFIALFQGLPDSTRLSEIMSIRLREIPQPTEYNQDEIAAIRKAKRIFALNVKKRNGERFDADISAHVTSIFDYYRKKAGDKNG